MWQIMWKRRRTSTKWKKTAKNAIFVLVDKGLPKQFRNRPSYLSDPCGRNVTPTAAVCNLSPTFFSASKFCTFEDSGSLWVICRALRNLSLFVWPFLRENLTFGAHYCPIFETYDVWYVNSHGQFFEAAAWSLHSESNVDWGHTTHCKRGHLEVFTPLQSLTMQTVEIQIFLLVIDKLSRSSQGPDCVCGLELLNKKYKTY